MAGAAVTERLGQRHRVAALVSGGKDSCYNMVECVRHGHEIVCIANLEPPRGTEELDSFMFQTVGHSAITAIAECMELPLVRRTLNGRAVQQGMEYEPTEGDEVEDLYELLRAVRDEHGVTAVSCGAILSDYQRIRVEGVCARLGLVSLAYLWRRDQAELLAEMCGEGGLTAVLVKVAAMGLGVRDLNRTLHQLHAKLTRLNGECGLHVCGEGGEYETLVLDCPLFRKRIVFDTVDTVVHSDDAFAPVAFLVVRECHLEDKVAADIMPMPAVPAAGVPALRSTDTPPRSSAERDESAVMCVYNATARGGDMEAAVGHMLEDVQRDLAASHVAMADVCFAHLYVRDMGDFAAVNSAYVRSFGSNPPSRACVQVDLPDDVVCRLSVVASPQKTHTMHVQSISRWAPACIGPYSQATRVGAFYTLLAGQIALDPGSMTMRVRGETDESTLAHAHVASVQGAVRSSGELTLACTVFTTSTAAATLEALHREASEHYAAPPLVVAVPRLPKDASVEVVCACVHEPWLALERQQREDEADIDDDGPHERLSVVSETDDSHMAHTRVGSHAAVTLAGTVLAADGVAADTLVARARALLADARAAAPVAGATEWCSLYCCACDAEALLAAVGGECMVVPVRALHMPGVHSDGATPALVLRRSAIRVQK